MGQNSNETDSLLCLMVSLKIYRYSDIEIDDLYQVHLSQSI